MTQLRALCLAAGFVFTSTLATSASLAQEQLTNRGFDTDLHDWTVQFFADAVWSPDDRVGSSSSGAADITTITGSGAGAGIYQCHPIGGERPFKAAVWSREPSGQVEAGTLRLLVQFFSQPDCDALAFLSTQAGANSGPLDTWELAVVDGLTPPGTASAKFLISAHKDQGGTFQEPFEVLTDDASFRLKVGVIFANGFEQGDTNSWSSTILTR